jgi:hypothetical protein
MYNVVDNAKGINLLDLGITSLRKSLMEFVNDKVLSIRQSLLTKRLERENFNISKKLYKFYLSDRKLNILKTGLAKLQEDYKLSMIAIKDQQNQVNSLNTNINSSLNIIAFKENENTKAEQGICPILKTDCNKIGKKLSVKDKEISKQEISKLQEKINEMQQSLAEEKDFLQQMTEHSNSINIKSMKTFQYLTKLQEAQKFSDYKYTKEDVQLYADSIKILDSFSGFYITQWLETLAVIINDLLKPINISIEFSQDKDFLKVINAGQTLKYELLSSGQKKFLGTIFKLGILLQQGINEGILIFDEGLGDLDRINLDNLIEILKGLNFQIFLIYQNIDTSISDVQYINVKREKNESTITG